VIEIARQAEMLTLDERLYLISLLSGRMQQAYRSNGRRRR
jgi:hypothetical protein